MKLGEQEKNKTPRPKSRGFNILIKFCDKKEGETESAEYRGNNPESHGHFSFRPAKRFKMVGDRSRDKNLPFKQFFAGKLDYD